MLKGSILFRQLQGLLPRSLFDRAVDAHQGDRHVQKAGCWSHFNCLLLALVKQCPSLRCIEDTYGEDRLATLGIGSVDRSTVSYAGRHRPAGVVAALFPALVAGCQTLQTRLPRRFRQKLYLLDATTIGLCDNVCPWGHWAPGKSGIKLHTRLDADGGFPVHVGFSTPRVYEIGPARNGVYEAGTILCADRAYFDSAWLWQLTEGGVGFVIRLPPRPCYQVMRPRTVDPGTGVVADRIIRFCGQQTGRRYRRPLRLVSYQDPESHCRFEIVTNLLGEDALTLCRIYRARWKIEAFFKWFKYQLRVRTFYGRSENAVHWQLWTALCLYLLLIQLKLRARVGWSLTRIQRKLERYLLERCDLNRLLPLDPPPGTEPGKHSTYT